MYQKKLIMTVGLPRSGKSTWATAAARLLHGTVVTPDAFRVCLHGQAYVKEAEKFVWAAVDLAIRGLFRSGNHTIILDATNLMAHLRAGYVGGDWQCYYKYFDASAAECKRRALECGQDYLCEVIDRMAERFELVTPEENILVWPDGS